MTSGFPGPYARVRGTAACTSSCRFSYIVDVSAAQSGSLVANAIAQILTSSRRSPTGGSSAMRAPNVRVTSPTWDTHSSSYGRGGMVAAPTREEFAMDGLDQQFEGHGRRWAHTLLEFLRSNDVEIPSDWPGTAEQAETLVLRPTPETLPVGHLPRGGSLTGRIVPPQ